MSASVLQSAEFVAPSVQTAKCEPLLARQKTSTWRPDSFARAQIRRLVRQLFVSNFGAPVRQVVFCPVETETDVQGICLQVAQDLALDTSSSVAMVSRAVGRDRLLVTAAQPEEEENDSITKGDLEPLHQFSMRIRSNLWLVPQARLIEKGGSSVLSSRLNELRREFEYSIIQGPAVGESSEAAALGQSADGIVLVLAAHVTRRVTALKIKEMLEMAQVRLLGTVLSERRFPVPEAVYRRL